MTTVTRTDPEPRSHRMSGTERREHLLEVAAAVVVERGIEAVTMESLAAAAGVSKGLGYAYFENRADVLLALLDRELVELEGRVSASAAAARSFEELVRGAVRAWLDVVEERGDLLAKLLQAGQIQGPLQERHSTMYRGLEEFYGQLAAEAYGIDRRRAVAAAAVLLAGLAGVIERLVETDDDRELLEETYVTVTLGAVERLAREEPGGASAG